MKLTNKAIEALNSRSTMLALALALGFTEIWIKKLVDANKDNGPLTTVKALQVIKAETKLEDSQILEEVAEVVTK